VSALSLSSSLWKGKDVRINYIFVVNVNGYSFATFKAVLRNHTRYIHGRKYS
jgi:hypothetical protein